MKLIEKKYISAAVLLFLFGIAYGLTAAETDLGDEKSQDAEGQEMREVDKFQYQLENRPDPFLPFLSKKNESNLTDDSPANEETGKLLTGMQLFEPGQLRLVALLKVGGRNVAMVEDVTGKGYRLSENMLIGRHGVIDRISDEKIEITESYKTKTGRVVTKEIVMRLKKEADK